MSTSTRPFGALCHLTMILVGEGRHLHIHILFIAFHHLLCPIVPPPHSMLSLGNELADLVDCRLGQVLPQVLTKVFWKGFEDEHGKWVEL